jgi:hypothetical protein
MKENSLSPDPDLDALVRKLNETARQMVPEAAVPETHAPHDPLPAGARPRAGVAHASGPEARNASMHS